MGIGRKIGKVHKKTSKYSQSKADYLSTSGNKNGYGKSSSYGGSSGLKIGELKVGQSSLNENATAKVDDFIKGLELEKEPSENVLLVNKIDIKAK